MDSKFAIGAVMGAFEDEHCFQDPFGMSTLWTVRRAGSNVLQKLTRERTKGDKLSTIIAESIASDTKTGVANAMERAGKAGFHPMDVLVRIGQYKLEDALAKLVKWESEPNGVPFNAGNARELLEHDGYIDRSKVSDETWKILEDAARATWESFHEDGEPFKGLEEIQIGDAYTCFILHWSGKKEAFRSQVMEEAAKN